jgi:hypothetical protein
MDIQIEMEELFIEVNHGPGLNRFGKAQGGQKANHQHPRHDTILAGLVQGHGLAGSAGHQSWILKTAGPRREKETATAGSAHPLSRMPFSVRDQRTLTR